MNVQNDFFPTEPDVKVFEECNFFDYSIPNTYKCFFEAEEGQKLCEMSEIEVAYLCGLVKKFNPTNIIEVGVAAGATTTMILSTIEKYKLKSHLTSIDLNKYYYRNPNLCTGFLGKQYFPDFNKWSLHTGYYLPELIEKFNKSFDFCIIDTVHALPGELLDWLVIFPFLKRESVVVFHDIYLHMLYSYMSVEPTEYRKNAYATNVVLNTIVGKKIQCIDKNNLELLSIGAVITNSDTKKYIYNSISALSMPWYYNIEGKELNIYKEYFNKYYGKDVANYFMMNVEMNKNRLKWIYNAYNSFNQSL